MTNLGDQIMDFSARYYATRKKEGQRKKGRCEERRYERNEWKNEEESLNATLHCIYTATRISKTKHSSCKH